MAGHDEAPSGRAQGDLWIEDAMFPRHVWQASPPWTERMVCSLCGLETTFARLSQLHPPDDEVCTRSRVERTPAGGAS